MSIGDGVMWRYYELLSARSVEDIRGLRGKCEAGEINPRDAKVALAKEIVTRFHSAADADEAEATWNAQFSRGEVPEDMPEHELVCDGDAMWIAKVLVEAGLVPSSSEGRRRLKAGAVQVDGEKITNEQAQLPKGARYTIKAGKRAWAAVTLK